MSFPHTIHNPTPSRTNYVLNVTIYYSFFEVFPLVYPVYYHMNLGQTGLIGLIFLCVLIGCLLALTTYIFYLSYYLTPSILKSGLGPQERRLIPALFAVFFPPIGLFLFAWTARASIHWVVPTIGITIYAGSVFIIFNACWCICR